MSKNHTKSLTVELNAMIKMFMSYGMNKQEAKRCVLKIFLKRERINNEWYSNI